MNNIVDFYLIEEVLSKDSTAQIHCVPSYRLCVGRMLSIFEREYYQAAQVGLRPEFCIETPAVNYNGEKFIKYEGNEYTIYRTYRVGTDKIQLFCAERVGNDGN